MNSTTLVAVFSVFAALSVGCAVSSEPEPTPEEGKGVEVQKPVSPEGDLKPQRKPSDGMTCTYHHGQTTCCDAVACTTF